MVDDDARATAEQLDGVGEGGGDDRPPLAMESTSTPEVTWSRRVVGQHNDGGGLDERGQRGGSR